MANAPEQLSLVHVAVIGAGPAGLAAMKCLQEEGFEVTGFERRPEAGGLWSFSENPEYTSATASTKSQLSKFTSPFTDFPYPDHFPIHPKTADLALYYQSYAKHFDIHRKIVFNVSISSVSRSARGTGWLVQVDGEQGPRAFDKVVLATGTELVAKRPSIEGMDLFEGQFIHVQQYKQPRAFQGKKVVVLGQGNSAADTAVDLVPHAKQVLFAHRRGANIFGRYINGQRFDKFLSWRLSRSMFFLERHASWVQPLAYDAYYGHLQRKTWGEENPAWRFQPAPSAGFGISGVIVNDDLIPCLREGKITSMHGIRRVTGPRSVEFDDGTVVEDVDAVIACTGYRPCFSLLGDAVTFSQPPARAPAKDDPSKKAVGPLPDLYQNMFPVEHADSLAVLNYCVVMDNAATNREIMAMAVAQVWAGKSALPSPVDMRRVVDEHHRWVARRTLANPLSLYEGVVDPHTWLRFVNELAGTGVYDHLGVNLKSLIYMIREPKMWWRLSFGVCTPHMYRLFETGKRKSWEGAREAILWANYLSDINLGKKKKDVE